MFGVVLLSLLSRNSPTNPYLCSGTAAADHPLTGTTENSDGDDAKPRGREGKEQRKRGASKRSLEWFFGWLEEEGRDSAALWREVVDLVVKTLITAQPSLARAYCACFCGEARGGWSSSFEECVSTRTGSLGDVQRRNI